LRTPRRGTPISADTTPITADKIYENGFGDFPTISKIRSCTITPWPFIGGDRRGIGDHRRSIAFQPA
jgi:hypothetical protein